MFSAFFYLGVIAKVEFLVGWTFIWEKTFGMAIWFGDVLCRFLWIGGGGGKDFVEFYSTIRRFVDISASLSFCLLNLGDDCLHGEIQPFVEGDCSWGKSFIKVKPLKVVIIIYHRLHSHPWRRTCFSCPHHQGQGGWDRACCHQKMLIVKVIGD